MNLELQFFNEITVKTKQVWFFKDQKLRAAKTKKKQKAFSFLNLSHTELNFFAICYCSYSIGKSSHFHQKFLKSNLAMLLCVPYALGDTTFCLLVDTCNPSPGHTLHKYMCTRRMHLLHFSRFSKRTITGFGYQTWTVCGCCGLQRNFAQMGFLPLQYSQWGGSK